MQLTKIMKSLHSYIASYIFYVYVYVVYSVVELNYWTSMFCDSYMHGHACMAIVNTLR